MSFPYLPTRWLVTTPDLGDDENIFPFLTGQVFLMQKGPSWPNVIEKKSASGRSVRCSLQSAPIWSFKVGYDLIRDIAATNPDLARLWAFYANRQGRFGSFFFWDPYDNQVANQPFGTGDGATSSFQLTRSVSPASTVPFVEPVYALAGTPTISVAGTPTTAFTTSQGMVTFSSPPASGAQLVWSGGFMFYCHFTQDLLGPQQLYQSIWSLKDGLTFESLIP